ncbi:discoidin domain-containing protein [Lysinibacillus sp. NPDC086135]|uniref:discoidin domain-containing protein n=1 Tax=Lysinibacillus sp. NPDC086135 TaxID=3364130 RepID=UPI00380D6DDA
MNVIVWYDIIMTSSTTPAPYSVTASSKYSNNYDGWKAFDGLINNDDGTARWLTLNGTKIGHIIIKLDKPSVVNAIQTNTTSLFEVQYPTKIAIYGSNDGLSFIRLSDLNRPISYISEQLFVNETQFLYYKIEILQNNGGEYTGFSEVKLGYEKKPENKTLILHDGEYKKFNGYIPSIPPSVSSKTIIPAMTSNTSPTGEAFSNKNSGSAFRLFDGNHSSAYPMSYRQQDAIIGYNFMKEVKIVKYGIICAKYYGLSAWKFEGSSDGVNWTTLDSQTGQSWNEGGEKIYTIASSNYYERYRINFSKTQNYESTSFYELKMYEYIEEIPSIPYYWSTVSSTLPNSKEFLEKGMDNLSPLFDRTLTTLNTMEMTNKSEILDVDEIGKVFSKTIDLKKYFDIRKIRTEVE